MLEEKTNLRSKDIKGTETYGKRPATMNQTHQVIGTCAAHISWNLRSRDSEVEWGTTRSLISSGKPILYTLRINNQNYRGKAYFQCTIIRR